MSSRCKRLSLIDIENVIQEESCTSETGVVIAKFSFHL